MPGDGLPSARDHADAVISKLVEAGQIQPDADAAKLAAGIPTFSKGTLALDPNTGKPVGESPDQALPGFTEGGVAVEAERSAEPVADKAGVAGSGKSPEELIAEHRQRLAEGGNGQATTAPVAPAEGTAPEPPAEQQAGAQAAEAAAQAIADRFAEYDEFEFEDPDLEVKIPVRIPKQYAESAKRGYGRRSAYDREMSWLKNAEPAFKDMVADGRIQQVLPLIRLAMENEAYGNYVVEGFRRAQQGLPLIEQARQQAQAAGATVQQPQAPADYAGTTVPLGDLEQTDPFLAEQLRPALGPILSGFQNLQQRFDAQDAANRESQERQRQQQQRDVEIANTMMAAHQDLARAYPDKAHLEQGAEDPFWKRAVAYARDAGYVNAYGLRAGIIFGAQQVAQIESERLAATASPAAAGLAANEQQLELARQQAAAASRTVGGGAPTQAQPAPRPLPPTPRRPDGTLKPAGEYLRETQAYIASTNG